MIFLKNNCYSYASDNSPNEVLAQGTVDSIKCHMNREVAKNIGIKPSLKSFSCKFDGKEVFVPFSFIQNYYEARGSVLQNGDDKEFDISQSYSKVYSPKSKYNPRGQFMHFKSFNVEARGRVKCVSAATGVPVSTQWSSAGYYYPTQIAQYALSHYSNHIASSKTKEHKTNIDQEAFKNVAAKQVMDKESNDLVVEFNGVLDIHIESEYLILCLDIKSFDEAAFKVFIQTEMDESIVLNYFPVDEFLSIKNDEIVFGFGTKHKASGEWLRITRDVHNDVEKVLMMRKSLHKYKKSNLKITKIQFSGHGQITNVSISFEEHLRMFYHGADWFLANQDEEGGWPSLVTFNKDHKKYQNAKEIPPGWYGAMCQGQAISVLVRAFWNSGKEAYVKAALKALGVFNKSSDEGGIRATFMDKYSWYEEYPTNPSSFILNGFLYSLLGLYDLATVNNSTQALKLYKSGLESLEAMLPMYDTGSGTFYDLRHVTMKLSPKGARWDYHSTHINQLLVLHSIERLGFLKETAERWRGYMVGIRASHN